jgi:hypothetical protein
MFFETVAAARAPTRLLPLNAEVERSMPSGFKSAQQVCDFSARFRDCLLRTCNKV